MFRTETDWIEFSAFLRAEIIAMMKLYCDESDDGETYALAGWLASTPTGWRDFEPAWQSMLASLTMPDGSPCKAFHAVDIVERDNIKDSPFRGWTFEDEKRAFTKAVDVIVDRSVVANLYPVGVAVEIPKSFKWIQRDGIWLLLFTKLFFALAETFQAQRSIAFMFDEKDAIAKNAVTIHTMAKRAFHEAVGPDYLSVIAFGDDAEFPQLQAADLLAYEWRKRISDGTHRPEKAVRKSWDRIRATRNEGVLWRYGRSLFDDAMHVDPVTGDQTRAYYKSILGRPTHFD